MKSICSAQFTLFFVIITLNFVNSQAQKTVTLNPYEAVDWYAWGSYLANLHTHTTIDGGAQTPDEMIDEYVGRGYDILAITDHDNNTWPWSDWNRDPSQLNIMAVRGVEASSHDHSNSFFTSYDGSSNDLETSLRTVFNQGGLSQINHPGRYNRSTSLYQNLFENYDHLLAMEVYNQGDRYPGDRDRWDNLLTVLMPTRPVWATSSDDSHALSHIGRNFQIMLMPEFPTEPLLRNTLINGEFYACYDMSADGSNTAHPDSVVITETQIFIYPDSLDTDIRWISDGTEVHQGAVLDLQNTQNLGNYVRVVLNGNNGARTLMQPFGLIDSVIVSAHNIHKINFKVSTLRLNSEYVSININTQNLIKVIVSDIKGQVLSHGMVSKQQSLKIKKPQGRPELHVLTFEMDGKTASELLMLP